MNTSKSLPPKNQPENGQALHDALSTPEAGNLAKKGRQALDEATEGKVPSDPQPRPSCPDLNEARDDLNKSVATFVNGVDTITDALLVILGKFDDLLTKVAWGNAISRICIYLTLAALCVLGYSIYKIEAISYRLNEDREAMVEMREKIRESTEALGVVARKQEKTDAKVESVKETVEATKKEASVEIVADKKTGTAKVVITPSKDSSGKEPASSGDAGVPSPPTPTIEIPIPGSTAR